MTKSELDHRRYLEIKDTPEYRERNARGTQKWVQAHPVQAKRLKRDSERKYGAERRTQVKLEVLAHYGPSGKLQCAWPDCAVTDVDMLSLDHIYNDGAQDRRNGKRGGGGCIFYARVRTAGFPAGFQTLCHNHQWKKELMRRREVREHHELERRPQCEYDNFDPSDGGSTENSYEAPELFQYRGHQWTAYVASL